MNVRTFDSSETPMKLVGKKYKIMSENFLTSIHILSVDAADVGEYQCKATNDVGSDTCVGSITLKG